MRTHLNRKRGQRVSATHRMSTKACAWQRYSVLNAELKKVRSQNNASVRQGEVVSPELIKREMDLDVHVKFAFNYWLSVRWSRVS